MAEFYYRGRHTIYNYSTDTLTEVPLSGEKRYYNTVITGQVSPVYVLGDGSSQVNQLPFIDVLIISTASNVDLETLRITGNRVKIFNSHTSAITVQTGVTGSLTYENINSKCSSSAFFDGTYWRVEDGQQIGDLKPWHKNFGAGTQSLPWGWVAMDGSTISDAESPFNGQTLEDLNGDGRFIRGAATSGTEQADAFQGHGITGRVAETANFGNSALRRPEHVTIGYAETSVTPAAYEIIEDSVNGYGTPRLSSETRPINMSVVWIIKIK